MPNCGFYLYPSMPHDMKKHTNPIFGAKLFFSLKVLIDRMKAGCFRFAGGRWHGANTTKFTFSDISRDLTYSGSST